MGDGLTRTRPELTAHGASETAFPATPPDAVAYPRDTAEVVAIVKLCAAHGCPLVPWGAGTSLEGHALAVRGGLCLDLSRMNRVLTVVACDMLAVVQPGLTRSALNTELRATGLMFPVDPGADASLGGMASTRASGTTAVRYGTMRDNVAALQVVLADGRVIRTGSRARKSASGYDLTGLFVGAEGTLGIITELTLRLHPQPEAVAAATCSFDDFSQAVACVTAVMQAALPMARIEFVDAEVARAFNRHSGATLPERPHLMVEFHGASARLADEVALFGEIVADHGGGDFAWATTPEARTALWKMRHGAHYACQALRPGAMALVTDVCVPMSELAGAVAAARADIAASGLMGPILGHVGDGNFHAILLVERSNARELAVAKGLAERMALRALQAGGTITGEHGVGAGKLGLMRAEHGTGWDVMAALKAALDPQGILNPGKLVEQPE